MAGDAGGNSPPRFVQPLPDITFVEGVTPGFTFPASLVDDQEGGTLTYSWAVVALDGGAFPQWLNFSRTSLRLDGTAPVNSPDYRITVTVSDGQLSATSAPFTLITSSPAASNRSPVVAVALPEQTWAEGAAGAYTIAGGSFTDPDGDPLSYGARLSDGTALPGWLSFDAVGRVFTGTPPAGSADLTVRVTATDTRGAGVTADVVIRTPSANVINGGAGTDALTGTAGADIINALAGDDTVNGGAGNDVIDGGAGADRLIGGADSDVALYAGARADYLVSRTTSGVVTVADKFGTMDTLTEIETLQFGNDSVATAGLGYQPGVSLAAGASTGVVYRFYNLRDKAYFYTASAAEKDLVVRESTDPSYTPENGVWPYFYQGTTFGAATSASGAAPVYRFYNTQTGHHFFTLSEAERALVQRESSDPLYTPENGVWPFQYEGVGYQAYPDGSHGGTVPVFRFFSPSLNRHFFTASTDEAQQIRQTGQWNDEGVGFWGGALTGNQAPVVATALFDLTWPEDGSRSYQLPADAFSDADGDTLTYSATTSTGASLPSWLSLDASTRTFSGAAPVGGGDVSVRVTARDGRGGSIFDDFTIFTADGGGGDDYAGSTSSTGRVVVNGSALGSIESASDQDWFRVTLTGGRAYVVDLKGAATGAGTLSDPYLYGIYSAGGKSQSGTSDDDTGEGFDARVNFTPSSGGDYFIAAGAVGSQTGSYTLSVSLLDDRAASTSTTGTVTPGSSVNGSIEAANDRDWFRVSLTSGRSYTIDLAGLDTGQGALADPYLYGVYDAGGKVQPNTSNDDITGGKGLNSRVTFAPSTTGTYYISAGANGTITGGYQLTVSAGSKTGGLSLTRGGVDGGGYYIDPVSAPRAETALVGLWDNLDGGPGS
jgi:hypothetical protein